MNQRRRVLVTGQEDRDEVSCWLLLKNDAHHNNRDDDEAAGNVQWDLNRRRLRMDGERACAFYDYIGVWHKAREEN